MTRVSELRWESIVVVAILKGSMRDSELFHLSPRSLMSFSFDAIDTAETQAI